MKSCLAKKPSQAYPNLESFLSALQGEGFKATVSDPKFLADRWSRLETPLTSEAPEPTEKNFAYHTKKTPLAETWGLVFRDSKTCPEPRANEIAVDFPDAALDMLLRKVAHPEWVGDQKNHLAEHPVRAEANVVVGPDCNFGAGVILESGVRIGARVTLGAGTRIGASSRIADDTIIGENCYFRGPVSIGGQGFGFIRYPKSPVPRHRIHVGRVVIGDGVQLGSFVAVDRGVFEDTVIGNGSATDNFVQVGHNCRMGKHNILCGFVGLAGSTILGDYVTFGGLVVTKGHLKVGNQVQVGGFSGINGDVPDGAILRGMPARPIRRDLKIMAIQEKLPEIYDQLKGLLKGMS